MYPPTLADALHMVPGNGWSIVDTTESYFVREQFTVGPCHPDPDRHHQVRRKFWDSIISQKDELALKSANEFVAELAARSDGRPIVVWTTKTWTDILAHWWVLDTLTSTNEFDDRLWLAISQTEDYRNAGDKSGKGDWSIGAHLEADFTHALAGAVPLSRDDLTSVSRLWRAFAAESPVDFDRARRVESMTSPFAEIVARGFGFAFPVQLDGDPLRVILSEFDHSLLVHLSTDHWRTPIDVIRGIHGARSLYALAFGGEWLISHRLRAWAAHPSEPPLFESRSRPGDRPMTNIELRLTPAGQSALTKGLRPQDAPPMHVGGAVAYDPIRTWCRTTTDVDYEIVQWRGT